MARDLVKYENAISSGEWPTVAGNDLEAMERIVLYEIYAGFVRAGKALEHILQRRLYEQRGYSSAEEYFASGTAPCKRSYGYQLIASANLRVKLGKPSAAADSWTEFALRPLTKIEPQSQAVRLARDAMKKAKELAKQGTKETGRKIAVSDVLGKCVKEVVAKFKGTMPKERKKKAKALQLADTPAEVIEFALQRVAEIHESVEAFSGSMWEDAEAESPGCVKRLAQACSDLASYLRS